MAVDYAALKTELQTDPTALGYAPLVAAGSDNQLADALNLARAAIQIKRNDISSEEIIEAVDVADYTSIGASPTAAQLSTERRYLAWLGALAAVPKVRLLNDDGSNGPVIANLQAMFPAGSATRTRLLALETRNGSRAEQLFGRGVSVSAADVAKALRG